MLVFSVPNFVARELFPLKPSVMAKLKEEGLLISAPLPIEEPHKGTVTIIIESVDSISKDAWPRYAHIFNT